MLEEIEIVSLPLPPRTSILSTRIGERYVCTPFSMTFTSESGLPNICTRLTLIASSADVPLTLSVQTLVLVFKEAERRRRSSSGSKNAGFAGFLPANRFCTRERNLREYMRIPFVGGGFWPPDARNY